MWDLKETRSSQAQRPDVTIMHHEHYRLYESTIARSVCEKLLFRNNLATESMTWSDLREGTTA